MWYSVSHFNELRGGSLLSYRLTVAGRSRTASAKKNPISKKLRFNVNEFFHMVHINEVLDIVTKLLRLRCLRCGISKRDLVCLDLLDKCNCSWRHCFGIIKMYIKKWYYNCYGRILFYIVLASFIISHCIIH